MEQTRRDVALAGLVVHTDRAFLNQLRAFDVVDADLRGGAEIEWRWEVSVALDGAIVADRDIAVVDASLLAKIQEAGHLLDFQAGDEPGLIVWTPLQSGEGIPEAPDMITAEFIPLDQVTDEMLGRVIRHATERVELVGKLQSATTRTKQLVENVPSAVYTLPLDGSSEQPYMSPVIEVLTGYLVEEWKRDPLFGISIIHPEDRPRFVAAIEQAEQSRGPLGIEYRYLCADGETRWVRNEARLVQDVARGSLYWYGAIYDISEQKETEWELTEREQKQAAIADLAFQSLYLRDLDDFLQYGAEVVARTLDVEFSKVLELLPDDDELLLRAGVGWRDSLVGTARVSTSVGSQAGYTLESDEPIVVSDLRAETRFHGPDLLLDHGVVSGLSVAIQGSDRPIGVISVHSRERCSFGSNDIDFMQSISGVLGSRMERDARDEELRFQASLLDAVDQAIMATDLAGRITYWSRSAEDLLGWSCDEVLGRDVLSMTPSSASLAQAREIMEALQSGESWRGEFLMRRRDGTEFWAEVVDSPIYDRRGNLIGIVGISADVSARHEAAEALRDAEARYRLLVEQIPAVVYTAHPDDVGHLLYQSPQIKTIFGYSAEEWVTDPKGWLERVHSEDRAALEASDARASETKQPFTIEYRIFTKDNRLVWLRDSARMVFAEDGTPLYWQGVSFDVTELKEAQHVQRLLASVVTSTNDAIISWSRERVISSWNRGAEIMFDNTADGVIGFSLVDERVFPASARDGLLTLADRADAGEAVQNFETTLRLEGRRERSLSFTVSPIIDEHGRPIGGSAIARDITDRKKLELQLTHQAFHDSLTGLPNRALFLDRLEQALQRAERHEKDVAVIFIDLDNFKVVNDSLGHARGDELLVVVAGRLQAGLRETDSLARMGGDEFTVLLDDLETDEQVDTVVNRLFALLEEPFVVANEEVHVTASVGVATNKGDYSSADDLVRSADTAMYRAKTRGKAQYALYDSAMYARALDRLQLEQQLRRAIDQGQFELHYQPFWNITDGRVIGVEALVRWQHPERGLLAPSEFLWIAEETGLISELDDWVLWEAGKHCRQWRQDASPGTGMRVSVNLSGRRFQQSDLDRKVASMLTATGLPADSLILEMTENDVMADTNVAATTLNSLKRLGVKIAVDDFGTGYSSLAHLKRFPIDYVKIDKNFIGGMEENDGDMVLVAGLIRLSQELGMEVIAEGVETAEQLRILRELKCDFGQGFLLYRPVPEPEIAKLESAVV